MKNFIIVGLLAFVLVAPFNVSAQTVTNEQLLTIIQSLMTQVLALMEKLKTIETQQVADSQVLQTVVQQTQPVVLGASTATNVDTPDKPEVYLGTPYCHTGSDKSMAYVPIIIVGDNWNYALVTATSPNIPRMGASFKGGGKFLRSTPLESRVVIVANAWGDTTFKVELGTQPKTPTSDEPLTEFTITQKMFIGFVCQ